jgi:hypothetical protein
VEGRLTRREGRPAWGEPYEGVPEHLRRPLTYWIAEQLVQDNSPYRTDLTFRLMAAERISLPGRPAPDPHRVDLRNEALPAVLLHCEEDDENILDVIHTLLQMGCNGFDLNPILEAGGSVWTATVGDGLRRRVDPTATNAYDSATRDTDDASRELTEAWTRAYGRKPDASDAWDHAIKAVEAILIPIVVPKQDKPQLGHVLGALDRQGQLWRLGLPGADNDHSVAPLVAMLRLLWPNPDRHGAPASSRAPSIEQARAVVQLAVTIVQWGRNGVIVKKAAADA